MRRRRVRLVIRLEDGNLRGLVRSLLPGVFSG